MPRLTNIVEGWYGTPFQDQHKLKGVGCDCFGLVRGVVEEYYGRPLEKPIVYSSRWNDVGTQEYLKGYLSRNLIETEDDPDILLFSIGGVPKHLGIVLSEDYFVHALEGYGVVRCNLSDKWKKRTVGKYRV